MERKPESGARGFARGFFQGAIQEDLIFPYPELDAAEAEELSRHWRPKPILSITCQTKSLFQFANHIFFS